jgi:serine/threonine protein kinase
LILQEKKKKAGLENLALDNAIIQLFKVFIKDIQRLNDNSLIHLDIRFPNILYNEKTNKINIIDFDLSSHKDDIYDNIAKLFPEIGLYPFEYSIIYYIVEVYKNNKNKTKSKNNALMRLKHNKYGVLSYGYTKDYFFDPKYGLDTLFSGFNNLFTEHRKSTDFVDIKNINIFYKDYIKKKNYKSINKNKYNGDMLHIREATNIYIPKETPKETSKETLNKIIEDTYNIIQKAESIYIDIIFDYYLAQIAQIAQIAQKEKKPNYIDICNELFSEDYYKKIDIFYIGVLMIRMNGIMKKTLFQNKHIEQCMCIEDPKRRISHTDLIKNISSYSQNPLMKHMQGMQGNLKSGGLTNNTNNLGKILEKSDTNIKKNIMPLKSKIPIDVSKSKSSFETPIEEISVSTTREFSLKLLNSINKEINAKTHLEQIVRSLS